MKDDEDEYGSIDSRSGVAVAGGREDRWQVGGSN